MWRFNKSNVIITKEKVATLLNEALKTLKRDTIIDSFKVNSLYLWNKNFIDFSNCLGHKTKTENQNTTEVQSLLDYEPFCSIKEQVECCGRNSDIIQNVVYYKKIFKSFLNVI